MFAINRKTGRLVVYQIWEGTFNGKFVAPDSFTRSDDGGWECEPDDRYDDDCDPEPTQRFVDDAYNRCNAADIQLVKTLPRGYDENGDWIGNTRRTRTAR